MVVAATLSAAKKVGLVELCRMLKVELVEWRVQEVVLVRGVDEKEIADLALAGVPHASTRSG